MEVICLDAEFADNEELLELSVYNLRGEEVYHSYFLPEKIDNWRTDIHHITPEMVAGKPTFQEESGVVQKLIDNCFAITGFAVDNDLRVLTRSGITGIGEKLTIDVKDMYWYMRGRIQELSPYAVPSLITCAQTLGIDFGIDTAHSASADTYATLECYNILFAEFTDKIEERVAEEESVNLFLDRIEKAKAQYIKDSAKGFVRLIQTKGNYRILYSRVSDNKEKGLIAEIAVEDRYKAEYDLRKLLKKKELPDKKNHYKLTSNHIAAIKTYHNQYDIDQSAWCKKIVRNLSKFTL